MGEATLFVIIKGIIIDIVLVPHYVNYVFFLPSFNFSLFITIFRDKGRGRK